jgi:hypothetical protein
MRNPLKVLVAALALAAASPAAAQYVFKPAWQVEKEKQEEAQEQEQLRRGLQLQRWYNVARVNVGVSMFYSEYYNCYYWYGYYPTYSCGSGSFASFIPFTVGAQVDFHLGGMNNITPGFNVLLGTATATVYSGARAQSVSRSVTIWEPTVDYVGKLAPPGQNTVGRFRLGGGMYIGPNSELGGAFRLGGGASFFNVSRLGLGVDLVLEAGGYRGYWIGSLQLVVSPELHF